MTQDPSLLPCHAQTTAETSDLPLEGLTVIDLSHVYAGPYCTFLMAMAGASVIKVEPRGGEHLRSRGDMGGATMAFAMLNSNKRSMTLNLKTDQGKDLLKKMVARADVLVENFAPGVTDRLGVGPSTLQNINPRLIYASSSGYGKTGPYRNYPAMDLVVQAMSGVIDITGYPDQPPVKAGPALCDFSGGIHLYAAIVSALFQRERTGRGRVVEVSMLESVYSSMASTIGMFHASGGKSATRTGNRHGGMGISPYNVYPATNGYVVINAPGDRHFQAILRVIGREELIEDPRFLTRSDRVRNMLAVDEIVESWTRQFPKEEVAEKLLAASVPCAPVRQLAEVMCDENMHARGSLQWVDHPELGRVVLPHSPLIFEGSPRIPLEPSRRLGQDSEAVLSDWLGYTPEEIEEMRKNEVF